MKLSYTTNSHDILNGDLRITQVWRFCKQTNINTCFICSVRYFIAYIHLMQGLPHWNEQILRNTYFPEEYLRWKAFKNLRNNYGDVLKISLNPPKRLTLMMRKLSKTFKIIVYLTIVKSTKLLFIEVEKIFLGFVDTRVTAKWKY